MFGDITMKRKTLLSILYFFLVLSSHATIKLSALISDNMVLQQNSEIKIWGKASVFQNIKVRVGWQKATLHTTTNDEGDWMVTVKTVSAGGPYKIEVSAKKEKIEIKNIQLGEVWFCTGQSNMEMRMGGFSDSPVNGMADALLNSNSNVRLFYVKRTVGSTPFDTCSGKWNIGTSETISRFSAVSYYFADILQQKLHVPIGIICASWGGSRVESWMKKEVIKTFPDAYKQTTSGKIAPNEIASNIYNGMVAPLVNYKIKGMIWYQGESNIKNYYDYAALQAAMVKSLRTDFGGYDFPFYYVQIAPYNYSNSKANGAAKQRESQFKAMSLIPNSGMVCTADIGDENNIHPSEKFTLSKRLALWALSETYGFKGLPFKSPSYKSMLVKDSLVTIEFDNVLNGLCFTGNSISGFEIAGADSLFYQAKAVIFQKQIRAWSPQVKRPIAVRYAFSNYFKTDGLLYNTANLPVLPFRTDTWKK